MKLTKEQAKKAMENILKSPMFLPKWLESYEFPDTPAESMWIWGGDRLPTKEDTDRDGIIIAYHPENGDMKRVFPQYTLLCQMFWTPAPKHLKKPESEPEPKLSDVVKTWYSQLDRQDKAIAKQLLFEAFTAGQQSQNK